MTNKAGDIQKNHYDVEGLRDQMEENGHLISFIYSERQLVVEEDENGEKIRYIRGHEVLASDSESARTYYHYASDEMGSITHITDEAGEVKNHYEYDAFGNTTEAQESVTNRLGFCGEIRDAITGQYYLRARFYNPVVARFMNEDTYYGDGLNLYAYCHNNPVGYVDPSGHICDKKYNELKSKDPSQLTDLERAQIAEYEAMKAQGMSPENSKTSYGKSSGKSGADNIADAAKLKEYYKQAEKYGTGSIKELENGRFRFYEELKPARTQGEMAGARHVREWDPYTGLKRDWYETLDYNGIIRQVRPDPNITGGVKVHYMFDAEGNYIGNWIPKK